MISRPSLFLRVCALGLVGLVAASVSTAQVAGRGRDARAQSRSVSGLRPTGIELGRVEQAAQSSPGMLAFVAFKDGNWDVYTWDLDPQHQPVQRTSTPYDEGCPSLSPAHDFVVYESVDGKIWRLELDGVSTPQQLPFASDQMLDVHPAVSPNGRRLAAATSLDRSSDDSDLAVYDFARGSYGAHHKLLAYQHYPSWSPDGAYLAFANLQGRLWTGSPISEIWVMGADRPWARQLTMLDGMSISPAWSPQGSLIAFASNTDGDFDLWGVDPSSRAVRQLTNRPGAETDPTFSPDGESIVYVGSQGGMSELYLMSLPDGVGNPLRPFGADSKVPCKDPDWR
jgi:Tol biopolymer transport system component